MSTVIVAHRDAEMLSNLPELAQQLSVQVRAEPTFMLLAMVSGFCSFTDHGFYNHHMAVGYISLTVKYKENCKRT